MSSAPPARAVVGGGMLGLTLALRLAEQGSRVTLYEQSDRVGGLASAWSVEAPGGPVVWDRHYHVTLLSDAALRRVLAQLGLEREMRWVETRTGYYAGGRLASVSNTVEFLRLPSLTPLAKLRLGATILHGARVRDWRALEDQTAAVWLTRWSGRATFERFWLPLLRAKLGESWREANAAFIWATIQRLYAARRSGLKKEMFGYVPGGYARILDRFAAYLVERGVVIRCSTPVASVAADPRGHRVVVTPVDEAPETFDDVIVTANPAVADRLCAGLGDAERTRLRDVRYQGIVCASVLLRRPLSPYYLTYLLDPLPFTAVVEMTAFVDPAELGGRSLVYLPKYVSPDDALFDATDAEIEQGFLDALGRIYPDFTRADVCGFRVSRVRRVFPIPSLGYSRRVPPMVTSVPGLHLVSSAQIVNGTLNANETVELAEAAARALSKREVRA